MPLCQEANETETNIYEVKAATEVHQSDKGINYEDHHSRLPRSPHPTHPPSPSSGDFANHHTQTIRKKCYKMQNELNTIQI